MMQKKCPRCLHKTYNSSDKIEECIVCKYDLTEVEAVPAVNYVISQEIENEYAEEG